MKIIKKIILTSILLFTITACGGGGGGGSSSSPGQGTVRTSPTKIDSGDVTDVTIEISEVDRNIILKVRYPSGLSYVQNTAKMKTPTNNSLFDHFPSEFNSDETNYLIFYLKPDQFSENGRGRMSFSLLGDVTTSGQIEIDIDVENEDVDNSFEFSVGNPNFSRISDTRIEVTDN